jgi:hypothetical protein
VDQSLNFFPASSVTAVILVRTSQNYPSVTPTTLGGFGVTELRLSVSAP